MAFKLATKTASTRTKAAQADEDEFAGLWINVGIATAVEGEEGDEAAVKFNRLPRGIAVSDLTPHRIYANSAERNPEWTEEAVLVNALIEKIREAGSKLGEGESMPLNFSVQLYRRQEQVASVATPEVDVDLDSLFG
ncbi:hypothetical protein PP753_gp13 [Dinoroseobacter phage vB_DshP-R7L]|uniref:Uncharacterized protein n=1 Tax=Dinoroseobacter phage vB_DshP-R7L TaxID=2873349 RepID=A0AAE8XCC6_9CAUD|nr:hypothetical protein PP753_gp13 [Dinoroseobacter phage vB_DshP-R7L]UAT28852.1 hypothetical protein R7L_gp13 [Dinoroseobacter phage vB_DshP-R7L]